MKQHQTKLSSQDIRPKRKPTHNVVYCKRSGVRFEIIDNFGLHYLTDSNTVHPIFLDKTSLRALLKLEYAKARKTPERLFDADWQDISLGKETEYQYKAEDQILSKSFIAGVVLAWLAELDLVVCKELNGRKMHELNLALCKHKPRANLIWMARRLLVFPATNSLRINLDTVYSEYKGWQHETKQWSSAISSYIEAMLEDEEERLPKLKSHKRTSIAVYDSHLPPKTNRLRNIDKPLNGKRVNSVLGSAIKILGTLKKANAIDKRKQSQIHTAIMNWPELSDNGMERLGDRLQELSDETSLSSDEQQILFKVGLAFSTGEIKMVGNAALYTLGETFLGEVVEKYKPDQELSLVERLKAKVKEHESKR